MLAQADDLKPRRKRQEISIAGCPALNSVFECMEARKQSTRNPGTQSSRSQFIGGVVSMGCDMMVALKQATVQGNVLFGLNHHDVTPSRPSLCRLAGAQ